MALVDEGDVNLEPVAPVEPGHELERAVRTLLAEIGEDPQRTGLVATPERVRRMYAELTAGYHRPRRAP